MSCDRTRSDKKLLARSIAWIEQGDEALIAMRWMEAKLLYEKADDLLASKNAKREIAPVLKTPWNDAKSDLQHRLGIFSTPQDAILSFFRLAANERNERILPALWNSEGTTQIALGKEKWNSLSGPGQDVLISYVESMVSDTLLRNKSMCNSIQFGFQEQDVDMEQALLNGQWRLGRFVGALGAKLSREGSGWRIVDVTTDIIGSSLSELLAKGISSLEDLRPLEKILLQDNAQQLLGEAVNLVFDDETAVSEREYKALPITMEALFQIEGGATHRLAKGSMVELLGESRTINGQAQVKVRPLSLSWKSQAGWILEAVLPLVNEESVWGTDNIPLSG